MNAEHRSSMLTLIRNADVYAPAPRGHRDLLVGGGRILSLAECGSIEATGADVVDVEGRWLTPGFVDGHAHITGGGGESGYASRIPPVALSRFTRAGVTSVVGLLGTDDTTRTTRELVASAYALREQGLGAWCFTGGYHVPLTTLTGSARDDMVFIDPVIGVGEVAISDHRSSQITLTELLRVASDAHVAGLITGKAGVLHLHLGDGERGLGLVRDALANSELPARVFHPTHVNRRKALFDEALAISEMGVCIDVTAYPEPSPGEDRWPADEAVRRYLDAGQAPERITVSSDGGGCLPVFDASGRITHMDVGEPSTLHETLVRLLSEDVPPELALAPITRNPAEQLRLAGRGRIEEGAHADLVCMEPDGTLRHVMAGGAWHVRDGEPVRRGPYEPRV